MYNWSVDIKKLKKHPQAYVLWKLEQLVNFGLGREKLSKRALKKHLSKLRVDRAKKRYLKFLLS